MRYGSLSSKSSYSSCASSKLRRLYCACAAVALIQSLSGNSAVRSYSKRAMSWVPKL